MTDTPEKKLIIPLGLIGQNSFLRQHNESKNRAFPEAGSVGYNDDYLRALSEAYPIEKVLGDALKAIRCNNSSVMEKIIASFELGNIQAGNVIRSVLNISTLVGRWHPYIINVREAYPDFETADRFLTELQERSLNYALDIKDGGLLWEISAVEAEGFVSCDTGQMLGRTTKDYALVFPSQKMVEHLADKVKEL